MCQLNVYMIDKYVSGIDVKEIFNKHHHHNFENINEEIVIKNYDDDYNYFEASNHRCDCGSIIGKLNNCVGKFNTYEEYLRSQEKDKILKLYKIKDLLQLPDYEQRLNSTLSTRDELFDKFTRLSKPIQDIDIEISNIQLKSKPNLQEQVRLKHLNSARKELQQKIENSHEYQLSKSIYEEFISNNEAIISSQNYTLEYKKDWWQENIDLAISKAEHECHDHTNAEFNHLKFVLNDIFKLTNEVKLFSIWQSDAKTERDYFNSLKEVKTTTINDLTLEDLVFLNYKDVITIKKAPA